MTAKEMLGKVDHTQLKAFATWEDIQKLCDEAIQYHTASVCVPPCYIKRIHDSYGEKINICTVVGFPLGYSVTEAKVAEVRKALEDGCNEIDMVVNIPKNLTAGELSNGYKIRRAAIDLNIPLITNARLASAFINAFCTMSVDDIAIKSWAEYK